MVLDSINKANDIKNVPVEELPLLASEIREFLIEHISHTGGHLASNLGTVELTMAMHLSFDLPEDKLVWDVGHQAYTHKLLTGRKEGFDSLRQYGGMSGFPKRRESECDSFDTGHSSTSISAGLGYVKARDLSGGHNYVVSIIGDGALTGGLALEALNNAAENQSNFIIVLNDNNMSISPNVGAISSLLTGIRGDNAYRDINDNVKSSLKKIPVYGDKIVSQVQKAKSGIKQLFLPGMKFEDMGITYLGPVDGHDIGKLCKLFKIAKKMNTSVIVHVITEKGRGYEPARLKPEKFHGVSPFDVVTGKPVAAAKTSYTEVFSRKICDMAQKDNRIVAITASMAAGTGLSRFQKRFPLRFFDVGIAEEHAVTFAAGLAAGGLKPYFAVYSSFLQRGFDEILHDVCIQGLPVVFMIDRAGLVGSDGETHQGIYDYSYMNIIPGMTVMAPKNRLEFMDMMEFANSFDGPVAIRYPRGSVSDIFSDIKNEVSYGKAERIYDGEGTAILTIGASIEEGTQVYKLLKERGENPSLINARFENPIDIGLIKELENKHEKLLTIEENISAGGFGMNVLRAVNENRINLKVINAALPDEYIQHGGVNKLKEVYGFTPEAIIEKLDSY
ncbi:MAG TPA: 1-deoxy-D-xylulose-5-phosphate synthase [Eubacterium sp.]|nr:1-deoxy-D-xylulose-5-phosphate synthase [Eubacterium sp.]